MENQNFKYQHTFLLYLIYEGYKCRILNNEEKSKIKELLLEDHPVVFKILKKYEMNGRIDLFWASIKDLIKVLYPYMKGVKENINYEESLNLFEQLSSPCDSALIRQKKNKRVRQSEKEFKEKSEESKESESSMNVSTSVSDMSINLIRVCESGYSPKILFEKLNYKEDKDEENIMFN